MIRWNPSYPVKGKTPDHWHDYGITYKHIDLKDDGTVDFEEVAKNIHGQTKMIGIQRSKGYSDRPSFMVDEIGEMVRKSESHQSRTRRFCG